MQIDERLAGPSDQLACAAVAVDAKLTGATGGAFRTLWTGFTSRASLALRSGLSRRGVGGAGGEERQGEKQRSGNGRHRRPFSGSACFSRTETRQATIRE